MEKQKDEELPKTGKTFQLWQGYLSMNDALNAIIENNTEYYQKSLEAAQESLSKAEKETN